jgi:hypothetical protein
VTTTEHIRIGVTTSPSIPELVNAGRVIVDHFHISFTTNRLLRLAIKFKERAPQADKFLFFEFLASAIDLSDRQKQAALSSPDIARVLGYADPTGEQAVNNVLHEQGRR